jgi:CRISPR/Cas system CMR subunit Cmr4 (Cas7 group RAMP superfamily)
MTERYEIIATLLTASPLAIHGGLSSHDLKAMGLMEPNAPFRAKTDVHEALEDCDALVVRDWRGLPYIPGSSLKGVIREYLERDKNHAQLLKSLLGTATSASSDARDARDNQVTQGDQGAQNDRGGEGGCVTFEDAFLDLAPRNEPAFSTRERFSCQGTGCHEEIPDRRKQWNQWESAIHNGSVGNAEMMKFEEDIWKAEDCFPDNLWRAETTPPRLLTDARLLPYWSPRTLTYVEQHTSVDRRTGTVHDGGLYNEEVVPAGLPFVVRMLYEVPKSPKSSATDGTGDQSECVTTTSGQEGLKLLLQALASFNLDPIHAPPQLGSNSRHGWGLMTCLPSTVQIKRLDTRWRFGTEPDGENAPWNPTDVIQGT